MSSVGKSGPEDEEDAVGGADVVHVLADELGR
jgi:hypothetical protein